MSFFMSSMSDLKPYCGLPFFSLRLTSEGLVYLCCFQKGDKPVGNLLEQSLDEIWTSELVESVRHDILKGKLHSLCKSAGGCPFRTSESHPPAEQPAEMRLLKLEIGLPNSHCNIGGHRPNAEQPACLMCERSLEGYRFEENRLKTILPKIKPWISSIDTIHVQGVAEPFWHDAIFDVLEQIDYSSQIERARLTTCTNGILLTSEKRKRFFASSKKSSLAISIDAATASTYKKIRRLDAFERVCENAIAFGRERNPELNQFQLQHNINLLNLHEVGEMVRFGKEANADAVEFNPTGGHPPEILVNPSNRHLFQEAEEEIMIASKKYNQPVTLLRPLTYLDE